MKYLIYKISGGLNHMLIQINNAIYVSKLTDRFLIIDCSTQPFCNDFNKYFHITNYEYSTNYECLYEDKDLNKNIFEPYINSRSSRKSTGQYCLNNKLITLDAREVLNDNDNIIYCTYFKNSKIFQDNIWNIKVNKDIVDIISKNKIEKDYIGLHYRNTDMEHNLEEFIPEVNKLYNKTNIIYLATDDYTALERLNKLLNGKFEIIQYTTPYNNMGKNIHYGNPDKDEVIMNSLIDTYHLTYSTYFIPSLKSSFSKRIIELRKKDDFF